MPVLTKTHNLSYDDKLHFPVDTKIISVDSQPIVLSPSTANWLCIDAEDIPIFEILKSGCSLREAINRLTGPDELQRLKSLLGKIISRNFAGTEAPPIMMVESIYKSAYFYLTNACNLTCPHCYMFSGKADKNELTLVEWYRIIEEFKLLGGENITLSGGEILAKKGWLSILRHAHQQGLLVTVLTNGTLWNREQVQQAAPCITEVQVSIDGPTEELNSAVRGDGSFSKALETAKSFARLGVRTSVAMTPDPSNINLYEEHFSRFFREHIADAGIHLRVSHKLLRGRAIDNVSQQEAEDYEAAAARMADAAYPDHAQRAFSIGHAPNQGTTNCGLGGLTISAVGEISPCNRLGDVVSYGNVREVSLSSVFHRLAKINEATSVNNVQPCCDCDLRYICGGGCRLDNHVVVSSSGVAHPVDGSNSENGDIVIQRKCSYEYKASVLNKMIAAYWYKYGK